MTIENVRAFRAIVHGRVQGVSFRYYTREEAHNLGVSGWVRNLPDGTVEVWAEGDHDAVESLEEWLGHGPDSARVDQLNLFSREPVGEQGFDIRRL